MANVADFISTIYDTLAKLLNLESNSQSIFMQMAWPGYSLSPADFKPVNSPNEPYDNDIAREVFSSIANIVPVFNKARFENSGFELDDIYEILIVSAIPVGTTQDDLNVNPLNRLFSDAQFEFLQARRGYKSDPNVFYYPCTATPSNWYDEAAAQFWPTITIKSTDIKPASTPTSSFTKAGGQVLVNQGVWKLKPDRIDNSSLKTNLQQIVNTKDTLEKQKLRVFDTQAVSILASDVTVPAIRTRPLDANIALATRATMAPRTVTRSTAALRLADTNLMRTPEFSNSLSIARNTNIFSTKNVPISTFSNSNFKANVQRIDVDQQNLELKNIRDLNIAQRFLVKDLINQQIPSKPASTATEGYSISFKFCRVNIDRNWFKLALLSNQNWYMFNTSANEYSTGNADNNPGMLPLLPLAFIAICDLKITANWSQEDRMNLDKAIAFGPFDIRNRAFNQNTLEVKGLQIIAWISRLMPSLPPTQA